MSVVNSLQEAHTWFLHNVLGSVECRRPVGDKWETKTCWTFPEAQEFYGVKALDELTEKLAETYGLGSCCGTCMYWQHTSRNTPASQKVRAECRRFPPSGQSREDVATWPETLGKDWCGEYSYCVHSSYAVQEWKP